MFVRFLPKSNDFSAVIYNFDKVHDGDAVLLETGNFGALGILRIQKPEDYINYFFWLSSLNHRIKNAQLHTVISSPGKSTTAEELKIIAKKWLQEMDYPMQPYLIFFHSDTSNNHVHIVSCRVRKNGTVISNSFDRLRSIEAIVRITGSTIADTVVKDCSEVLSYNFQSHEAFKTLMQRNGYRLVEEGPGFNVYKYGRLVRRMLFQDLDALIDKKKSGNIQTERIKDILSVAAKHHDRTPKPVYRTLSGDRKGAMSGYRSALSVHLRTEFALETVYQADENGAVRDYFIIDPAGKQILESSALLSPEIFLSSELSEINDCPPLPHSANLQHILSGFNFSISDDVDDASLYHKKKNRNT